MQDFSAGLKPRILVIGLDAAERGLLESLCDDYRLFISDGVAGLREFMAEELALVVTDVWLDDGHVLEVRDILHTKSPAPFLIVVISTLDEDMAAQFTEVDSALILQRPLRKMEVESALRIGLQHSMLRKNLASLNTWVDRLRADGAEAARLKSEFLSLISHELRTPLTEIIGYAELMQDGSFGTLESQNQEFVESILRSSNRLSSLIDDLMTLSKAEAGTLKFEPTTFPVNQLIEGRVGALLDDARSQGYKIEIQMDESVGVLRADRAKLRKTLMELLSNAVKFTPDGGVVGLEVSNAESAVLFKVYDTGRGMPQEKVKNLFHAFRQEDSSDHRKHGGLGIGLSLVRYFVEMHGGNVRVISRPEHGTVFSFVLPRHVKNQAPSVVHHPNDEKT